MSYILQSLSLLRPANKISPGALTAGALANSCKLLRSEAAPEPLVTFVDLGWFLGACRERGVCTPNMQTLHTLSGSLLGRGVTARCLRGLPKAPLIVTAPFAAGFSSSAKVGRCSALPPRLLPCPTPALQVN